MADAGLRLGVEGEKDFKRALTEINQTLRVLGSEMTNTISQFDKSDKSVKALSERNKVLGKEIEEQKKKVALLSDALKNSSETFGENDKRTKEWEIKLNNANATLNDMERELKDNKQSMKDFGKEVDDSGGKFEKLGSIVKGVGAAIGVSVAAIGAAIGGTVSKLNEYVEINATFEDSMLQVAATMGITSSEIENGSESYEKLTKAAKEAGSSTRYSASEAGEALNYLALAGYDADAAVETLPKVLNLAAAGGMELATTSDLVTDAMSALGMETGELDLFIDQLAKTSQKSNTSVQQLGEGILVSAGTAKSTGQSLTTLNTALGVLADNGIKGSEGGTKLRNMLLSLSAPTDKAAGMIENLGLSVFDAQGNMRQIDDIMVDLNAALGNLTQEGRTNAINTIFNKTDISAVNALLASTSGRFEELYGLIDDSSGAATEMAATMEAGLAGTTRSFDSAMEGMEIEVGSIFSGLKKSIISDATGIIQSFTGKLSESGGDFGKISEAIGETLQEIIGKIGDYLPQIADIGMKVVGSLASGLMSDPEGLKEAVKSVIDILLDGLFTALPAFVESLPEIIDFMVELLNEIIVSIIDFFAENSDKIIDSGFEIIISLANGIGKAVSSLISNSGGIFKAGEDIITGLWDGITSLVDWVIENFGGILNSFVEKIPEYAEKLREKGPELIQKLFEGALSVGGFILEKGFELVGMIAKAILDALPKIKEAGSDLIMGLLEGIASAATTVINKVKEIGYNIAGKFKRIFGGKDKSDMETAGEDLAESLGNGFESQMETISKEMKNSVPTNFNSSIDSAIATPKSVFDNYQSQYQYTNGGNQTVVLQLDGRELGSAVINTGRQEANRQGYKTVLA